MTDTIRHRGPDDDGHFVTDAVALGMRRLSIIDVAGGHQPIGNEDGTVTVVFNGEIYNYRELRSGLVERGHEFTTCSDTEVLVHLYEEHGSSLVERLRGMFAFALWDAANQRLLLARDRLGIKPVFYRPLDDGLIFGSEIRAIRAFGGGGSEVDPAAVAEYLALGYVPDPRTIYDDIRKLPPGCVLEWESGRTRTTRYWQLGERARVAIGEPEAVEETRRLVTESVRYRLISDVPLGAFLSGGLDSSTVVAAMTELGSVPVRTYAIGFREDEFNEAPEARIVADHLGALHHERIIEQDVDVMTTDVLDAFDEPFADPSAIPTYLVAQLAVGDVKVVLSGDGGDEAFGGYTRYVGPESSPRSLPAPARLLLGSLARRLPRSTLGRNRLISYARQPAGRYAMAVTTPLRVDEGGVAAQQVADLIDIEHILDRWFAEVPERDFRTRLGVVDLLSYLPGDILTKVDRMTMAVSLEARVPLLDHELVEFTTSLPDALKFRNGTGKWVLREAVRGMLPDRVLERRKQGFAVPLKFWLNDRIRYRVDALLEAQAPVARFIDRPALAQLVQEFRSARRDHSALLWKLIVLNHWLAKQ